MQYSQLGIIAGSHYSETQYPKLFLVEISYVITCFPTQNCILLPLNPQSASIQYLLRYRYSVSADSEMLSPI